MAKYHIFDALWDCKEDKCIPQWIFFTIHQSHNAIKPYLPEMCTHIFCPLVFSLNLSLLCFWYTLQEKKKSHNQWFCLIWNSRYRLLWYLLSKFYANFKGTTDCNGSHEACKQFLCSPPDPQRGKNMDEYYVYLCKSYGCGSWQKLQLSFGPRW